MAASAPKQDSTSPDRPFVPASAHGNETIAVRTVAASKEGSCQDSIIHTWTLSKPTLFSCLVYKYLPLPLLNVFFLSSYHKHLKQTTHYYKQVIPTTTQYYNHHNSTSLITTTAIMSGIINKIKDAVTGDHSSSTTSTSHSTTTHGTSGVPEGTAGPHSSRAANAADPRVGKSYSPQPHFESSF